jgi:crotonyl-CoA reductase
VQEILDAILAENYDAIGGIDVPDRYRGVTVREREADTFAGLRSPKSGCDR